jgi:hypothetical protein
MAGIGMKIVGTAAQKEQFEHLVRESLGGGAGREGAVRPVGLALTGPVRYGNARVRIAAQKPDEGWRTQVHSLESFFAIDFLEKLKLREERFELRSGGMVGDFADATGELKAAGVSRGRLKEAFETATQVRRPADIGLVLRVCAMEGEDSGCERQLRE